MSVIKLVDVFLIGAFATDFNWYSKCKVWLRLGIGT